MGLLRPPTLLNLLIKKKESHLNIHPLSLISRNSMDLIDNSLINIRSCRSKEYCEKFESHDPKGCKDAVSDSDGPRR